MYYFYIVRCNNNSLYCGQTNNLNLRIYEHNFDKKKASKYVWAHRPVVLVYSESFKTRALAMYREREVKRMSKSKKESLLKCLSIENNKVIVQDLAKDLSLRPRRKSGEAISRDRHARS